LWILHVALFLGLGISSFSNVYGQSNKIDSIRLGVDTLRKGAGGIEDLVDYQADDSIILDMEQKVAHLYGNARVHYTDIELTANYIRIDFSTKQLFAKGLLDSAYKIAGVPHFKQGDNEFDTDSLYYNFESKRAKLNGLRLVEEENYIICNKVFRNEDGSIITDVGKVTTCNLEHPHFYFRANKLKIIPDKKIAFGPANLWIEDVPTPLFIPFGLFPIKKDRKNGIIFPQPQMGALRGFGITNLGYHLHVSDKMNLVFDGDIFFGGSYRIGLSSMYAKRYKYDGLYSVSFAYNINQGSKEENNLVASRDYRISWEHREDGKNHPGRSFSARVNFNGGNYNQNFNNNTQTFGNTQFNSTINYSKVLIKNRLNLNANTSIDQNTSLRQVSVNAPTLALTMQRLTPFKNEKRLKKKFYDNFGINYTGRFSNEIKRADTGFFDLNTWTQPLANARRSINHSINADMPMSFYKNFFNFTPFFNFSEDWFLTDRYQFDFDFLNKELDTARIVSAFGRVYNYKFGGELRTNIFGTYNFPKARIKAIRHAMTPSVVFSYTPDFSRPNFGFAQSYSDTMRLNVYNVFTGSPFAFGRNGNIAFSIANVFSAKKQLKDSLKTLKRFNILDQLNFSANYNALADSFNWSNIAANVATRIGERVSFNMAASFTPYQINNLGQMSKELKATNKDGFASLTFLTAGLSANLNPRAAEKRNQQIDALSNGQYLLYDVLQRQLLDFAIPWSLNINATATYNPFSQIKNGKVAFVPSFDGNVSLTQLWKITFNSGFDVIQKSISETTTIGLARNLHCWTLQFDWTPVGSRRMFMFRISPEASALQSLKLQKRSYWWNNF